MNFLGLKFWPKVIFWGSMKDAGIFLGHEKRTLEGIFWGIFKKVVIFFGSTNSEVVIFLV